MNAALLLAFAVVLCCCVNVNSQRTGEQTPEKTQPLQGKGDLMRSLWIRLAQSLKQGQQSQKLFGGGRILPMMQGGGNHMDVLGQLLAQRLKQRNQVQRLLAGGLMGADTLLNAGNPADTLLNAGNHTVTLLPSAGRMMGTGRSGTLEMLAQKLLTQGREGRGMSGGHPTDDAMPRDGWMTGTGGAGLLESVLVKGMQERAPGGLVGSGGQSVLGGPLQKDIGSPAERLTPQFPRLGRQGLRLRSQLPRQRPQAIDQSGRWSAFVPDGASKASWNRTLEGVEVGESGWCWNTSDVTAALVRSRDAQLREVNYTRASTLYVFREADTLVAVRPEQRLSGGPCFILPSQTVTYQQTEDTLNTRNDTVLAAPSKVLNLNATGGTLAPFELRQQFSQNPSLLFFCGFAGVVPATLADDAMFPTQGETETERVLKIVSMDTELNILVPKRPPFPGRFPANRRDSGRQGGLIMPRIFSMMG